MIQALASERQLRSHPSSCGASKELDMTAERIASLIRHLATFFGGTLMTKWAIPPEYLEAIVGGLAAVAAVVWGIASKTPIPPPSLPPDK